MKNQLKTTETKVQKAFFQHIAILKHQRPEYEYIMATPNAGGPNMRTWGNVRKAEGASSGFPDISVLLPRGGYYALYIELKIPGNKPSRNQIAWLNRLNDAGYLAICITTDDWRELTEVVDDYLYKKTVVKKNSTTVKAKT